MMKKRVLSLLLLTAMLVTALPLAAISTLAADVEPQAAPREFVEADYNALYKQEGLVFAFDIMLANEHWGLGTKGTVPTSIYEMTEYVYNGTTYKLADETVRNGGYNVQCLGDDGKTKTYPVGDKYFATYEAAAAKAKELAGNVDPVDGVYTAADKKQYSVINDIAEATSKAYATYLSKEKTWFSDNAWKVAEPWNGVATSKLSVQSYNACSSKDPSKRWRDRDLLQSEYTVEAGYIQIRNAVSSDGGITMSGIQYSTAYATNNMSRQYVATLNKNIGSTGYHLFYNIRPAVTKGDGSFTIKDNTATNDVFTPIAADAGKVSAAIPFDEPTSLTFTLINGLDQTAGVLDTYMIRNQKETLVSFSGTYTPTNATTLNGTNRANYGNASKGTKIYAWRDYNVELSQTDLARNHFADIAKWYKLDLSCIKLLSDDELLPVYAAAADFTVDTDDRETIAAAVEGAARKAVESKFSSVEPEIVAVAATYGLDLLPLTVYPKAMLPATYALFRDIAGEADPVAAYEAALLADLASSLTADDYNALYVQDRLVSAFDFTATNKYWSGEAVTATNISETEQAKKINAFLWKGTVGVYVNQNSSDNSVTSGNLLIKDGALELSNYYLLNVNNIQDHLDFTTGATMETVRTYTTDTTVGQFFGLRLSTSGGKANIISYGGDKNTRIEENANIVFSDLTKVSTIATYAKRPAVNQNKGNTDLRVATVVYAEIEVDGYGTVVDTTNVVYGSAQHGSDGKVWARFHPYTKITPDYIKTAEGYEENTAKTVYYVAIEPRFVKGEVAIYQNGAALYENDDINQLNSPYFDSDNYILLQKPNEYGKLYFHRYYDKELTPAEMAQNHFADLAKFFRLNLTGFDMVADEDLPKVYAALADYTVEDSYMAVQAALVSAVLPLAAKGYEALKTPGETEKNAFIDLAAENYLPFSILSGILTSPRDMSSVYERSYRATTADTFAAEVTDAYLDAYCYLSYTKAGEDDWNALMLWFARDELQAGDSRVDLEDLQALPFDVRLGLLDREGDLKAAADPGAVQAIVDAFVSEAMAAYENTVGEYDYNSLYAALDEALIAVDFFSLNKYWGEDIVFPTVPYELTDFEFLGKGYNFTKPEERLVTSKMKFAVTRPGDATTFYWCRKPDGANSYESSPYTAFKTREEAEAYQAELKANGHSHVGEVVELKLWMVERFELNANGVRTTRNNYVIKDGADAWDGLPSVYFDTQADALAKAKEFAGAGAILKGDNVYASADGKYEYVAMWEPIQNDAYKAACEDYAAGVEAALAKASILEAPAVTIGQYLPTLGPRGHHSIDGGTMQTGLAAGEGFLSHKYISSNSYLTLSDMPTTGDLYAEYVMAGGKGATGTSSSAIFTIRDIEFRMKTTSTTTTLIGTSKYQGSSTVAWNSVVAGAQTPFTYAILLTPTDGGHTVLAAVNGESVYNGKVADSNGGYTYDMIGFNQSSGAIPEFYAIRYYTRALTAAEQLQNRFADVAKFYRLDMSGYEALDAAGKSAMQTALTNAVSLKGFERKDVQTFLDSTIDEYMLARYAAAGLDADFMTQIAATAENSIPNLFPLLAIREADARRVLTDAVLAEFPAGYAVNGKVLEAMLAEKMAFLDALTFRGMSVRIHTGYDPIDMPGVRAQFVVDDALLTEYAGITAFGVEILNPKDGENAEPRATLTFGRDLTGESVIRGKEDKPTAATMEMGERVGTHEFAYTVIYSNSGVQTKKIYEHEMGYRFFVVYNGKTYTRDIVTSFGETVSAADVYKFFAENGEKYKVDPNDSVIQSVMDVLNTPDTPAEQE